MQQENCDKLAKKRDYSDASNNYMNRKCVQAINVVTQDGVYFRSMYAVQQELNINAGIFKMVCEGINYCKTGISKKGGQRYRFEYILTNEVSIPDEKKVWKRRRYICPRYNKSKVKKRKVKLYLHRVAHSAIRVASIGALYLKKLIYFKTFHELLRLKSLIKIQ